MIPQVASQSVQLWWWVATMNGSILPGFVRFVTGYGSGGRFSTPYLRTAMDFFWVRPIFRDRITGIGLYIVISGERGSSWRRA